LGKFQPDESFSPIALQFWESFSPIAKGFIPIALELRDMFQTDSVKTERLVPDNFKTERLVCVGRTNEHV